MKFEKTRLVLLFVGSILIIVTGLFFNVCADVFLRALALQLIIPLILALGGGVFFLMSESDKDKKIRMYVFKGVGILLTIGFIIFICVFKQSDLYIESYNKGNELEQWCKILTIVPIILCSLALVAQVGQTVLEFVFGDKE